MNRSKTLKAKPPRSPAEDINMKEFLLEQFKQDWIQINHNDKMFHALMKCYFVLLSGLWLALSAIYTWKLSKGAIPGNTDFFIAMQTECVVAAGIILIMGIVIYMFHLFKRKWNCDATIDVNRILAAFVQCSLNPNDAKKYLFHPVPEVTSPQKHIKYSRLSGMDAIYMYIFALSNGLMVFTLFPLFGIQVGYALLVGCISLGLQILIYWLYLHKFDK